MGSLTCGGRHPSVACRTGWLGHSSSAPPPTPRCTVGGCSLLAPAAPSWSQRCDCGDFQALYPHPQPSPHNPKSKTTAINRSTRASLRSSYGGLLLDATLHSCTPVVFHNMGVVPKPYTPMAMGTTAGTNHQGVPGVVIMLAATATDAGDTPTLFPRQVHSPLHLFLALLRAIALRSL